MPIVSNKANRKFAPLDVSVSVVCASPKSPFMQTMAGDKFFPDRTQSGFECIAYPQVNATAKDDSWDSKQSNMSLANMVWKVSTGTEWKDISKINSWSGKYSIDTSNTSNRGSLTIKRNLSSNDKQQLQFEADLYDYRTNSILHITADPITLYTADKGADTYGMGIREDTDISYNPFLDKLALYEYKVANNIISASTEARNACFDGNQYECHIPIDVYKSKDRITSGFSIELYRGTTKMSASSAESPNEVISISASEIVLDLRLVEKNNYTIKAVIDGKAVAQFQFSASRFYPSFGQPKFMVCNDIEWGKIYRSNKAILEYNGRVVEYPNRIVELQWHTEASNGSIITKKSWQEGNSCTFSIEESGLGDVESDYLEEQIEYRQRPANDYLIDEDSNYLLDEDDNALID